MSWISRAIAVALACSLVAAGPTLAVVNEFSAGEVIAGSPIYNGIRGNQGIRTDPATVSGVSYVHIVQADLGASGGDFYAIGTTNGAGTNGGPTQNCPDSYTAKWSIYTDGVNGGIYFCKVQQVDSLSAFTSPAFSLSFGTCNSHGLWIFSFNGTQWECRGGSSSAAIVVDAGIEVVSSNGVDRNIDALYTNMQTRLTGSTTWSSMGTVTSVVFPNYSFLQTSPTTFAAYLAPLD